MENMKEMLEQEEMNLDVHKGSVVEGEVVDVLDDKAIFPSATKQKLYCRLMNMHTRHQHL